MPVKYKFYPASTPREQIPFDAIPTSGGFYVLTGTEEEFFEYMSPGAPAEYLTETRAKARAAALRSQEILIGADKMNNDVMKRLQSLEIEEMQVPGWGMPPEPPVAQASLGALIPAALSAAGRLLPIVPGAITGLLARLGIGGAAGVAGAGLLGAGLYDIMTPGGLIPDILDLPWNLPPYGIGIARTWESNRQKFYLLVDGTITTRKKNGVWKRWRPYRSVVLGKRPTIGQIAAASKKMRRMAKALSTVLVITRPRRRRN